MYCPYCAHPLHIRDDVLYCEAGEDEFSQVASAQLLRIVDADPCATPELEAEPTTHRHCPRCAARMHRMPGKALGMQYARCGCELNPSLQHLLVELRTYPYAEEEREELARLVRRIGPRAHRTE